MSVKAPVPAARDVIQAKARGPARAADPAAGPGPTTDAGVLRERAARLGHRLEHLEGAPGPGAPRVSEGPGAPLPPILKAKLAAAYGARARSSIEATRLHVDGTPRQMNAMAYTRGHHITITPEDFDPRSEKTQALSGHEFAHVLQQGAGLHAREGGEVVHDAALEARADRAGEAVARGEPVAGGVVPAAPAGGGLAPEAAPIQRGIYKVGSKSELYVKAPTSNVLLQGEPQNVKNLIKAMVNEDFTVTEGKPDVTLKRAIAIARTRLKASGRFVTGRPGKRLRTTDDVADFYDSKGADTTEMRTKFHASSMGPAYDAALNAVEISELDFTGIPSGSAYPHFTSTFNSTVPVLTRTISAFGEVVDDLQSSGSPGWQSIKGSWFETWAQQSVLASANRRVAFAKKGKMAKSRSSDGYESATKTLWDMKDTEASVDAQQAADYHEVLTKQYKSADGKKVSTVNYLFRTKAGAVKNDWLASTYGFGVYYVDTDSTMKQYA